MSGRDEIDPHKLYADICLFLHDNGLRREEKGSGWWYGDVLPDEMTMGPAIEELLSQKGIDTRNAVLGESKEYWG